MLRAVIFVIVMAGLIFAAMYYVHKGNISPEEDVDDTFIDSESTAFNFF
ncbi:MAG: hypothetical protein ACQESA_01245 [Patescibacteria group bacterium]